MPSQAGDGPVQDDIASMPGWKQNVGRRLDDLITAAVLDVEKTVQWNSPFYGEERGMWFLSFHCLTRYIKVAFFRGSELQPIPPVTSKQELVRYLHIPEDGSLDAAQVTDWVQQASRLPGEKM